MNSFKMIFVSSFRVRVKDWFGILSAVTKRLIGMVFLSTLFTGFLSCAPDMQADDKDDKETETRGIIPGLLLAALRIDLPNSSSSREITLNARIENALNEEQEITVSFYRSDDMVVSKQDIMLGSSESPTLPARQSGQMPTNVTSSYTVPTGDTRYSYGYCVETSSGDSACAKSNVTLDGIALARTKLDEACPDTVYSSATTQTTTNIPYTLTFNAKWTSMTHPTNYPRGRNPHFTTLVGAAHNDSVVFWQRGEFASAGVEVVAEDGIITVFSGEIRTKETNAVAATETTNSLTITSGISGTTTLTVSQAHPFVTMISMLAPSPDWFIGIGGFDMRADGSEDTFYDEVVIPLRLYDAGTQAGDVFDLGGNGTDTGVNADMSLRERITRLSTGEGVTDFGNNNNLEGTPCVGNFTIKKQ